MPRVMTQRGQALLEMYPPFLRKSHLIRAICNAAAGEFDIRDEQLERLAQNAIASSVVDLFQVYEDMLRLPRQPGLPDAERKQVILTFMGRVGITGSGVDWRMMAFLILGEGWTYEIIGPEYNVLIVQMPLVQGTLAAELAEALLRSITPASMRIDVTFGGGFLLDESRLDEDVF